MNSQIDDNLVFPHHHVSVDILDENKKFPVGKIYCVGRNYLDHINEIQEDPKDEPFFFSKPPQSISQKNLIKLPDDTKDLQYEVELVVFIGNECSNIKVSDVKDSIFGYAVGIDLTKRDIQKIAKKKRRPWELSKGFNDSAPISLIKIANGKVIKEGKIELHQNKQLKQHGYISNMIWPIEEIISKLSNQITLYPGDIIFTGTPSGVGSISAGDHIKANIEGIGELEVTFI